MAVIISRRSSYCPNFATTPLFKGDLDPTRPAWFVGLGLPVSRGQVVKLNSLGQRLWALLTPPGG